MKQGIISQISYVATTGEWHGSHGSKSLSRAMIRVVWAKTLSNLILYKPGNYQFISVK